MYNFSAQKWQTHTEKTNFQQHGDPDKVDAVLVCYVASSMLEEPPKKCIKGGSWGEVGCMSACCGFMFVVNLCSLPLSYFVRFVRVFLGVFLCLSFHPTLFRIFLN